MLISNLENPKDEDGYAVGSRKDLNFKLTAGYRRAFLKNFGKSAIKERRVLVRKLLKVFIKTYVGVCFY